MSSNLQFLVLLVILASVAAAPLLVIDFLRHGARAPIRFPKHSLNVTWGYTNWLTPVGERQHYLLGHLRRQRYIENEGSKILPEKYDPTLIYARSSYVNRTMMSLQSYLLGLYPTGLEPLNPLQVSHAKDLLAPPINLTIGADLVDQLGDRPLPNNIPMHGIHTVLPKAETVFGPGSCKYIQAVATLYNQKRYPDVFHKFDSLWRSVIVAFPQITMDYLATGGNAVTFADFMVCSDAEGLRPRGITLQMIDGFQEFLGTHMKAEYSCTPQTLKIVLADITKEILGWMNRTLEGKTVVKYAIYSGHDTTLTGLLLGLQQINATIEWTRSPPFAGNLLFELGSEKDHPVSVIYDGQLIHQEPYESFKVKFGKTGELGMTREEACAMSPSTTGLRREEEQRKAEFDGFVLDA